MQRKKIVSRNIFEVLPEGGLKELLNKKNPVVYWGTAPTGKPHLGYFFPLMKVNDFLNSGIKVKILFADLHAALDGTPWEVLEERYKYYKEVITLILKTLGAKTKGLEFVRGSDFQLSKKYVLDLYKLMSISSERDSMKAASEVVKMGNNPKVSGIVYPLMQSLDEEYLGVDAQLGGVDQRKIMVFAREKLPKLGYKSRVEIMNPLVGGLSGGKMSASNENSKIGLSDSEKQVEKKIRSADCVMGKAEGGIFDFLKYIVMVLKEDKGEKFVIERSEKYGGNLEYSNYETFEKNFNSKKIHPLDFKISLAREVNNLLGGMRKQKEKLEKLEKKAYK